MNKSLKHYGILGMHWGRRKQEVSVVSSSPSREHLRATELRKKRLDEMSNDEIRELATRLQLEKQFKDLTKKPPSGAQKFVGDVLRDTGKQVVSEIVKDQMKKGAELLIKYAAEAAKKKG